MAKPIGLHVPASGNRPRLSLAEMAARANGESGGAAGCKACGCKGPHSKVDGRLVCRHCGKALGGLPRG